MARIKGAMMTRKRRNKVLKLAKSYWGSKSTHFKMAKQAVMKSGTYAYVGRKLKNAQKFLKEGNRVKVTVRFRGREMAHTSIGEVLLKQFGEQCAEVATVEKNPKLDGRHMTMFLSPKGAK